ncbi:Coq4 family protein [Phenylobacterium sp.]|uniref:Coq4 family protein n=1 Tax=Phenylobacterium sp. TaxID=1871053 RepID=UPI002F417900
MSDATLQDFSYFLGGVRPVQTDSSVLVSSSKYLNEPAIREWIATQFLRRNGPDLPSASDTSNGLIPALAKIRDDDRLDRLIAAEKATNDKFRAWLERKPICRHTLEDFARYAPGTLGGVYHRHVVDNGFQLNLGWTFPDMGDDREYMLFRSGQIHDFDHILTGGGFDTLGELLPFFLRMSNLHAHMSQELASELFPVHVFGGLRMAFRSALHYPATWLTVLDLMQRGFSIGLNSGCLLMADFESAFHLPLDEARKALGVVGAEDVDTAATSRIFDGIAPG